MPFGTAKNANQAKRGCFATGQAQQIINNPSSITNGEALQRVCEKRLFPSHFCLALPGHSRHNASTYFD